ncbi:MAG: hypothetical protein KJ674_02465 [Nanoarchaeota archaeon]|nr:hypothetical protein [Nanoarchaeota archaeon]
MKRSLLLLFLLIPQIVSAQSINFFGKEYNLVIFIPIALIALALFILAILYFIESYKHIKKINKLINLKDIFKLLLSFKFKKKKIPLKEEKVDVKRRILLLQEKLSKLPTKDILNEITSITKDFYKHNLNITSTLTGAELKSTLKENQTDVLEFSEKLSELKYSGKEITKENVKELFNNLNLLIKTHTPHNKLKEEDEIKTKKKLKRARRQLSKNFKHNINNIKNDFSSIKNYFHKLTLKSKKQKIFLLIKQGKKLLDQNTPSAKNFYIKALLSYYKLRLQEEKEIYSKLEDFHEELNQKGHGKKELTELSRKIIHFKHKNEPKEGLKFFKQLKNYVKNEEKTNIKKIQKYTTTLKYGEQNLIKNIKELENYAIQKDKKPLLHSIKKLKHTLKLPRFPLKEQALKLPEIKLTPPPKTKIQLSPHMSKLLNEKNLVYNKLRNLEQETRQYQRETNIYQQHVFAPKNLYTHKENLKSQVKKYNPHKKLNKLSHEKDLITRKLISLR